MERQCPCPESVTLGDPACVAYRSTDGGPCRVCGHIAGCHDTKPS